MKLTPDKIKELKAEIVANEKTQAQLAAAYGISRSLVSDIATDRAHVNIPWPEGTKPPKKSGGGQANKILSPEDYIAELEAENVHLRAERDRARKIGLKSKRDYGTFKAMSDELDLKVRAFPPLPPARDIKLLTEDTIEEHAVLHLSDGHHDQIVRPDECGGHEETNFRVSCRRAEQLVDTTIKWTQSTLSGFNFKTLTVLAYGDHTSGEIHNAVDRSESRNMFKNCFSIGELHALMYRDLAPYFDHVNVVYVPGNHGRRSINKDHHGAHNNWDFMVAKVAERSCRDIPNISFLIPDAFSVNIEINGVGFNVSHGDDIRGHQGIPFYGMVRRQKSLIALNSLKGTRIRYYCMGHHHVSASLADIDGELLVNGAWIGTDAYAYNSFAGYREPSQWLHGVHPKYGITWRLNVQLRTPGELKGPQRYKIEI